TAAATAGSQIEITGTLDTDGLNQDYRIEFFAAGTPDGSSHGEAERYLGFATITTDGSGDATFTVTIEALAYAGEAITATATVDNGGGSYGDTSEFAANFTATAATNDAPTFMPVSADGIVTTSINYGARWHSVTQQDDGKILVAGRVTVSGLPQIHDFALARYNTDGSLDTAFGGDGIVTLAIGPWNDFNYSVAVQSDGNILVAGYSESESEQANFAVVRYTADGSLDTTFDSDGIVTTDFATRDDFAYDVTVQSDGKVLVAGFSKDGDFDFALTRYNVDGSLDTSFDTDGIVTTDFGSSTDTGYSVTVQSDGKILLAGRSNSDSDYDFALVRYNADGSLDTTFDTDGKLTTDFGSGDDWGRDVAVQSDGKILVVGEGFNGSNMDIGLVRYNADGSLDTSFDSDGIVTTDFGSEDDGRSVTVQSDGKILVAGYSWNGSNQEFILIRYNADGSLDPTFDTDGIVATVPESGSSYGYSVTVQSDGKILVSGLWAGDAGLVRYNADGSLDTTFDSISTLDGTPSFTEGGAAVLDSDVEIRDAELDALNSGN
ncbi:MAG: hypothetical protein GY926_01025, partial [bacterium]|nr:hypothetical protein [bacterium]